MTSNMISKEKFEEYISKYQKNSDDIDYACGIFPDFFESSFVAFGWYCFRELIKAYFTEEGVDWIDYFLFENPEKCYYQNEERIRLETVDDLWEIVKDYRK